MQEWVLVLVYAIILVCYVAVHQIIFKYRFKELAFTILFLNAVFFLLMIVAGFKSLVTWLFIVSIIILVLYAIYVNIMIRTMRDKIQKQVMNGLNIEDMFKSILKGDLGMNVGTDDEIVPMIAEETDDEQEVESKEDYDIGDIIIDDEDKDKDRDKDKKE